MVMRKGNISENNWVKLSDGEVVPGRDDDGIIIGSLFSRLRRDELKKDEGLLPQWIRSTGDPQRKRYRVTSEYESRPGFEAMPRGICCSLYHPSALHHRRWKANKWRFGFGLPGFYIL
ncbi:hypothetical protein KQX54_017031 [Cotesia glomerata]|uniref:Uncharacterized protein n=1 Tax=Cotesia glomerata TaxID=32391 RepID=A0AAV7I6W1_COTGL|nr:hypothetical protein KQX54_017031 [Cotesia glomerata]